MALFLSRAVSRRLAQSRPFSSASSSHGEHHAPEGWKFTKPLTAEEVAQKNSSLWFEVPFLLTGAFAFVFYPIYHFNVSDNDWPQKEAAYRRYVLKEKPAGPRQPLTASDAPSPKEIL